MTSFLRKDIMKIVIPELSADSISLVNHLRTLQPGQQCSYSELTVLIRRNVQKEARGCLETARRILQREEQIVFAPIRGVGLKRLTDGEITKTGTETLQRINRASRRGVHKLTCVKDFNQLTNEEKVRHNAALSVLGVFYEVSKARGVKQIEAAVSVIQKQLPLKDALQAFIATAA